MHRSLIGIAGGSGSGKSTLAIALHKAYPNETVLVQLDDYYKTYEDAPRYAGGINWDHPDALRFDELVHDLNLLLKGEPVKILTKSELYNPGYRPALRNKIEWTLEPRALVILDGYLALYDPRVRQLINWSVFLDMSIEESVKRRTLNKFSPPQAYFEEILFPIYRSVVVPTKQYADLVLDASTTTPEEIFRITNVAIQAQGLV